MCSNSSNLTNVSKHTHYFTDRPDNEYACSKPKHLCHLYRREENVREATEIFETIKKTFDSEILKNNETLARRKSTTLGYVASLILKSPKLLLRIFEVVCFLLPWIKREITEQKQLMLENERRTVQYNRKQNNYLSDVKPEVTRQYQKLNESEESMMSLVGGSEVYEKAPKFEPMFRNFDCVFHSLKKKPQPIKFGTLDMHLFFALTAVKENDKRPVTQLFWLTTGHYTEEKPAGSVFSYTETESSPKIVPFPAFSHIFDDKENMQELAKLIRGETTKDGYKLVEGRTALENAKR